MPTDKIIYFDTLYNCWCVTARENYEAHIHNARAVLRCPDFAEPDSLKAYFVKHGYGSNDTYTIIPKEGQ